MKIGSKFLKTIILVTIAVAVIAVVLVTFKGYGKRTIVTSSTLREVISINELSTGEFYYNGVVSIPKKDDSGKTDYSVKYNSIVKAGIDASDIDFEIDKKNKTIKPIISQIKINDITIDDDSISTIPENATGKLKEALSHCKEDALNEANQNTKLIETAKSNLQDSITALLTPIVKESGYKIVW